MAAALAVTTRLESLTLSLRPRPDPASRPLSPPTPIILPALTKLAISGVYEYLEDFLARIDPPLLYYLDVMLLCINVDVPQLRRLIDRADEFKTFDQAEVLVSRLSLELRLYPKTGALDRPRLLQLRTLGLKLDHQLSSLARLCSSSFPLTSALEELKIREDDHRLLLRRDFMEMEHSRWVEPLDPFPALKSLYLTDEIARRVCRALQELSVERATEVLPALRNIFVDGPRPLEYFREAFRPFVTARKLSGHPVLVDRWKY